MDRMDSHIARLRPISPAAKEAGILAETFKDAGFFRLFCVKEVYA
jgi:hypothetical protein